MDKKGGLTHRVFVGLDCLLDTRLAALGRHAPEITTQLLISGAYHKRRHNVFSVLDDRIDDAEVEKIHSTYSVDLLKESMATGVVPLLGNMVLRYKKMENKIKEDTNVLIDINMWPYKLDVASREAITDVVGHLTLAKRVTSKYIAVDKMTPGYLSQYHTVVWYEFNEWLNIHHGEFKSKIMAEVEFYCPEIFVKEDEELETLDPAFPAASLSLLLCDHIKLNMLSLEKFSLYNPF